MDRPKYTPKEYLSYLKQSKSKHLLVEGSSDQEVFEELTNQLKKVNNSSVAESINIIIDTAESLVKIESVYENSKKVEHISKKVSSSSCKEKFRGFVDREFSGFTIESQPVQDNLKCHKIEGCLIWSRGHSIENYFFEYCILETVFENITNSKSKILKAILDKFESSFIKSLKWATALSLAAYKIKKIKELEKALDSRNWEIIEISSNFKIRQFKLEMQKSPIPDYKIPQKEFDSQEIFEDDC